MWKNGPWVHVVSGDDKTSSNESDRPVYRDSGFDVACISILNIERVVEDRTHDGPSARDPAVQMASRMILYVVEQACDVLDTMRMHAAQCKDTRTLVQILDLLDNAEMTEKATNMWRADIAVAEVQGEVWFAFKAAMSCLVEGLCLTQTAFEEY